MVIAINMERHNHICEGCEKMSFAPYADNAKSGERKNKIRKDDTITTEMFNNL
jgi:hypothetical protein